MSVKFTKEDNVLVAHISGDIDHHNAKSIREEIDNKIMLEKPETVELDFRELEFMDSSGIGLIMGRYKLLGSLGGRLCVTNVPHYFKKVIRISGLEQLGILERSKSR